MGLRARRLGSCTSRILTQEVPDRQARDLADDGAVFTPNIARPEDLLSHAPLVAW
jgi:hypothetical protein